MAYVNKNGLNEKVLFLGNSNEIDKILCYSDLFLLPSEMESFGLVALEAMANEVPVISSNAGGLSEVNKHGVTGFLSEIGDVTSMAENALKLLLDDDKLKQFKKQAKEQAQLFDIDVVVKQYEAIYQKALEN
jgi:glycosyltransferase involved in cell wall biosynthesis